MKMMDVIDRSFVEKAEAFRWSSWGIVADHSSATCSMMRQRWHGLVGAAGMGEEKQNGRLRGGARLEANCRILQTLVVEVEADLIHAMLAEGHPLEVGRNGCSQEDRDFGLVVRVLVRS